MGLCVLVTAQFFISAVLHPKFHTAKARKRQVIIDPLRDTATVIVSTATELLLCFKVQTKFSGHMQSTTSFPRDKYQRSNSSLNSFMAFQELPFVSQKWTSTAIIMPPASTIPTYIRQETPKNILSLLLVFSGFRQSASYTCSYRGRISRDWRTTNG